MAKNADPVTDIIGDFEKKWGVKVGAAVDVLAPVVGLPTGSFAIDYATGVGGLPGGRITECFGPPSSGKSTTALQAAVVEQRRIVAAGSDDVILYLDFEHALDLDYCKDLGLDLAHPSFLVAQPHWLEQGAELGLALIGTGRVRMSIWDSVAAMTPKALIDGDFDQRTAAMNRARLMSGLCQRLASLLDEQNCAGVFINHLMEAVEMSGMSRPGMPPRATTPGGKGLKFYASTRLEFKQVGNVKGDSVDGLTGETTTQSLATHVKVKVVKNKVGTPFREVEVLSRHGMGFDDAWSALQVLIARGLIVKAGALYYFDGRKVPDLVHEDMPRSDSGRAYLRGQNTALLFSDNHPVWRQQLIAAAVAEITSNADAPTVVESPTESWSCDA